MNLKINEMKMKKKREMLVDKRILIRPCVNQYFHGLFRKRDIFALSTDKREDCSSLRHSTSGLFSKCHESSLKKIFETIAKREERMASIVFCRTILVEL